MINKMKCIILCAGYSTRLYPLTLDQPKPLLPIAGKPMVEHILEKISQVDDIDEVIIVTNQKFYDNFRNWKRKFSFSKPIKILNDGTESNKDRLGAVGDINFVIKKEEIDDCVCVIAGDNLFKYNLNKLFDLHKEKQESVVALYDVLDKSIAAGKYGVVELDDKNKVIEIEEKPEEPKTSIVSTACYIFSKDVVLGLVDHLKEEKLDNIGDFIKWIVENKELYGIVYKEKWFDIGTKDQLEDANIEWNKE